MSVTLKRKSREKEPIIEKVKKIPEKIRTKLAKYVLKQDGTIKPFSTVEVSTRTVIVFTTCNINLSVLFQYVPITDFDPVMKRRGRKKRFAVDKEVVRLPYGSVIRAQYELKVRGLVNYSQKNSGSAKQDEEETVCPTGKIEHKKAYFLHCVVLVIAIDNDDVGAGVGNKFKNVKIYSNGKLQITGCKNDEQYIKTIQALFLIFGKIQQFTGLIASTNPEPTYRAVFNTVMQNMDFFIGFSICRNKLDHFINSSTEYRSIYEGSMNTGVNIKIPVSNIDGKLLSIECNKETNEVSQSLVEYNDYKQFILKKGKKEAEHTFLVFATGHVIFTSAGSDMETVFHTFITLMIENRAHFEEQKL